MQELPPLPPGEALARSNPEKALELIQAQIAGVKKEIVDLTVQLVPGTSDARESAIETQLEAANERLESLQSQLDRVVSGEQQAFIEVPPRAPNNDIPHGVRNIVEMVVVAGVMIALGLPLIRVLARRLEPRPKGNAADDTSPRLDRLEQAMDAVAIEVERVSEGQRYTNKILGELRALPAPNPADAWPLPQAREEQRIPRSNG